MYEVDVLFQGRRTTSHALLNFCRLIHETEQLMADKFPKTRCEVLPDGTIKASWRTTNRMVFLACCCNDGGLQYVGGDGSEWKSEPATGEAIVKWLKWLAEDVEQPPTYLELEAQERIEGEKTDAEITLRERILKACEYTSGKLAKMDPIYARWVEPRRFGKIPTRDDMEEFFRCLEFPPELDFDRFWYSYEGQPEWVTCLHEIGHWAVYPNFVIESYLQSPGFNKNTPVDYIQHCYLEQKDLYLEWEEKLKINPSLNPANFYYRVRGLYYPDEWGVRTWCLVALKQNDWIHPFFLIDGSGGIKIYNCRQWLEIDESRYGIPGLTQLEKRGMNPALRPLL